MNNIAVLLTSHNRKEKTLLCLRCLHNAKLSRNTSIHTHLVDDGSTDGTVQLIHSKFKKISIISADGTLFWNRGMHLAFSEAAKNDYDFYLWLNDDTFIYKNALIDLLITWKKCCMLHKHDKHIIIGTTCDPDDNSQTTYGGIKTRNGFHPFKYDLISPTGKIQYADTMNGNLILIPRSVYNLIGNLEFRYTHSMGDFDYGYRAKRSGCNLVVCPAYLGECKRNDSDKCLIDQAIPINQKLKKMLSKKGLPYKDWRLFCLRNGGLLWPVWTLSPYLKMTFNELRNIIKRSLQSLKKHRSENNLVFLLMLMAIMFDLLA